MIEYVSKPGGRHLYSEDMINLQNMVLAFTEFFKDCQRDFVISGCNVLTEDDGTYINEGYVWLGGKVRYVPKTKSDPGKTRYMIPNDTFSNSIIYATPGISGPIYKEYGVKFVNPLPAGYNGSYLLLYTNYYDKLIIDSYSIEKILFNYYAVGKDGGNIYKPVDFQHLACYGLYFRNIETGNTSSSSGGESSDSANAKPGGHFIMFTDMYSPSPGVLRVDNLDDTIALVSLIDFTMTLSSIQYSAIIGENLTNTQIKLPTVNTNDMVVSETVNTKTMSINGTSLDVVLRPKTPLTGWIALSGTDNLVAKQVNKDVFITGRLPFADESVIIKSTTEMGDYIVKQTSVKLPDSISRPSANTVFNVRGGNHCYHNGSANMYFDSDGYLCIEIDKREAFIPNPSSVCWHYMTD